MRNLKCSPREAAIGGCRLGSLAGAGISSPSTPSHKRPLIRSQDSGPKFSYANESFINYRPQIIPILEVCAGVR
jgi:hypothetical protein